MRDLQERLKQTESAMSKILEQVREIKDQRLQIKDQRSEVKDEMLEIREREGLMQGEI